MTILKEKAQVFGMEQIDNLFVDLSAFSPIHSVPVPIDDEQQPFGAYIQMLIQGFHSQKGKMQEQANATEKAAAQKVKQL